MLRNLIVVCAVVVAAGPAWAEEKESIVVSESPSKAALLFNDVGFAALWSMGQAGSFDGRSGFGAMTDVKLSFIDMLMNGPENRFRIGELLGATGFGSWIPEAARPDRGLIEAGLSLGLQSSFKVTPEVEIGLRAYVEGRALFIQNSGGWTVGGALLGRFQRYSADVSYSAGGTSSFLVVNLKYLAIAERFYLGVRVDKAAYGTGGTRVDGVLSVGLAFGSAL